MVGFELLADNYRVFAIPRRLLTKQDAKAAFEGLSEQVANKLPDKRHILGTPVQWSDFLAVEYFGASKPATRAQAICLRLREAYGGKNCTDRQRSQTYQTDVNNRVAYLESRRDRIFPDFPLAELLKPMQSRRAKRRSRPSS